MAGDSDRYERDEDGNPLTSDGRRFPSSTGGPGPRNVDMTNWRKKRQQSRIKFDDDAKATFLEVFGLHGRVGDACRAADVCEQTMRTHLEDDPEFAEAYADAKALYRDRVREHAQSLIFSGVDEPIVGGKFKDKIIAFKRVYPINLIAMELRRTDPEYKERQEIDLNTNGGVLVAPAGMSPQDWINEQNEKNAERDEPDAEESGAK